MTIAGIVKHLAWVEDLWFQGRFVGGQMPAPWDRPGADGADESMRLVAGDSVESIVELYTAACDRSRRTAAECPSRSQPDAVAAFGGSLPVTLRWILMPIIDETARQDRKSAV